MLSESSPDRFFGGCYRLGSLYMFGRGVRTDYNLAEVWFREAAKGEYAEQAEDALKMLTRYREKEQTE
ncbi:MAG: SEL1-like repeat protein [Acidaminococcaceae bacterium]|nr:SEL1-like repeat protein [Acidaminococcaceae bacterium]